MLRDRALAQLRSATSGARAPARSLTATAKRVAVQNAVQTYQGRSGRLNINGPGPAAR
jgi:hypothetical protein